MNHNGCETDVNGAAGQVGTARRVDLDCKTAPPPKPASTTSFSQKSTVIAAFKNGAPSVVKEVSARK